jgi:hypothetical protein
MKRRQALISASLISLGLFTPHAAYSNSPFDFSRVRSLYLERLQSIRRLGNIPIIDIESSYNPIDIDLVAFTKSMDRAGIAMMCLSVDQPGKLVAQGSIWSDHAMEAFEKYPGYFIPVGNGGNHPAWTKLPETFLQAQEQKILEHNYPMMGEFEVRHYPSPRQVQRGETFRDVDVPIDGPLMERVFQFSEKTGIPFQIHYEIEDRLLGPLEQMLKKYSKAKVIWCHLAQIRYQQRSTQYSPELISRWLDQYPNLYIDTAFGDAQSNYPPSGERHARYWNQVKEWSELIASRPYRFLAALDIGGDRMNRVEEWTRGLRYFLETLPQPFREIVANKAAWKLLFNEEV